jgi:hypothetical protein
MYSALILVAHCATSSSSKSSIADSMAIYWHSYLAIIPQNAKIMA